MSLAKGERFTTKDAIFAAGIKLNNLMGFKQYPSRSDKSRLEILCPACKKCVGEGEDKKVQHDRSQCDFVVTANLQKAGGWRISKSELTHSCKKSERSQQCKSSVLALACPIVQHFKPSGHGDIKQLQSMMQSSDQVAVKYHQAYTILEELKGNPLQAPFDQLARLPSLLIELEEADPTGSYEIQFDDDDAAFRYCFICPSAGQQLWKFSRKLLCCDGAHVRSLMRGTLLTATVKDANAHSVLLALLYCPSEDAFHWELFLKQVRQRFAGIELIMSDKDKGGTAAASSLDLRLSVCLKHIEKNLKSSHSTPEELKRFLWSLGRSATSAECDSLTAAIRKELPNHEKAIEYILSRKTEFCTEDFLSEGYVRFNELTNNTAEVKNRSLKAARGLPVVDMIMLLLRRESELWAQHHTASLIYKFSITDAAHRMAQESLAASLTWDCKLQTVDGHYCEALVWIADKYSYRVILDPEGANTCDCRCGKAINRGYPCDHGIFVLSRLSSQFPDDLVWSAVASEWYDPVYHTATWRRQYEKPFKLADFKEAELEPTDLKPWAVAPQSKGRPKEKRFEKKSVPIAKSNGVTLTIRKVSKCSLCNATGHNRRSCTSRDLRAIEEKLSSQ